MNNTRKLLWTEAGHKDYLSWKKHKDKIKRINALNNDILNNDPTQGIGKPEKLKYELSGSYSRRIDQKNRSVYEITDENIIIQSCKYHYKK